MRIAVTGANGFVGRHLMAQLQLAGLDAIGLCRKATEQANCHKVSFQDTHQVVAALEGADSLIHLIGKAHAQGQNSWQAFQETNVHLTLQIAQAALAANVKRFIYVSSVKALGETTEPGTPFNNASAPDPQDDYGRSKLLAEQQLNSLFSDKQAELIIVRPPLIWGETPKGNLAALLRWAKTGIPLPLNKLHNKRHWVSVELLCEFLIHLATTQRVLAQLPPLLVSDPHALSTTDAIKRLLKAENLPSRFFSLPQPLWRLLARLPMLRGPVAKLTESLEVDAQDSWAATGWHPTRHHGNHGTPND
ncbi:NAD-dependent epimerase/dehydratase family protein [Simiduia aestuariiviva]|uniref:Nucleoside-diphosphate-sugar epimerase n=1 Tax=Simiduia aestuariiviva TaxID=1510459 RepID=A0A839UNN1_9GAMM|nr:NAD-dependent epimerase/dehydratase family protein [Simiduia aestuariiviva]MBB3168351.1 nucleoside-diphosphate-sugar epimerase [Simiduia aestuariiviva]